jgi:hypothetical protein
MYQGFLIHIEIKNYRFEKWRIIEKITLIKRICK